MTTTILATSVTSATGAFDTFTNAANTGPSAATYGIVSSAATGSDANTTLTVASNRVQFITPTANRTYTLPTTSVLAGDTFTFHNLSTVSSSDLRVLINSSAGSLVRTVWSQTAVTVMALKNTPTASTDWMCLTPGASQWTQYTPTYVGFGTVSGSSVYYRRVQDSVQIRGVFTTGTNTGSTASLTLPLSLTSASNINTEEICGTWTRSAAAGAAQMDHILIAASATTFNFSLLTTAAGGLTPITGTTVSGNGENISVHCMIPISTWTASNG